LPSFCVARRHVDKEVDEARVDRIVDVDPFDGAAGLAAVEKGAVDQRLRGGFEGRIRPHVGRVLAPELKRDADEPTGR